MKSLTLIALLALLFAGCSSRQYYKPSDVEGSWRDSKGVKEIVATTPSIALLSDNSLQVGSKNLNVNINKDEHLVGYSDGWIILCTIDGRVRVVNVNDKIEASFDLKKTVASASIHDDFLAVLFANNEMALYSLSSKTLLLKEQGDKAIVVNSKIVPPLFKDDLVIYPTLDGKIVIVSVESKKKLRTIIVDGEKYFTNILFLDLIDGKMVAATANKMLSLSKNEKRASYDVRSVIRDDKDIYIATKQGEIIKLDSDLNPIAKQKFSFAHILGLVATEGKIYAAEQNGYLLELPRDLSSYKVYKADIDEDGFVYIYDKKFHIGDELISVE